MSGGVGFVYLAAKVDRELTDLDVTNVVVPHKGKTSQVRRAEEHRNAFRRTIKWRTGSEGRIGNLAARVSGLAPRRLNGD